MSETASADSGRSETVAPAAVSVEHKCTWLAMDETRCGEPAKYKVTWKIEDVEGYACAEHVGIALRTPYWEVEEL